MAEPTLTMASIDYFKETDEARLVAAARSDPRAFGRLYALYIQPLFRYLYSRDELAPRDPLVFYNLACSYALTEQIERPARALSLAIDHMQEAYRPGSPADADRFDSLLGNMKNEIQRVSRFAESFLEFGKSLELTPTDADMGALLRKAWICPH